MVSVKGIFLEIWKVGPCKKKPGHHQIMSFGVQDCNSDLMVRDTQR